MDVQIPILDGIEATRLLKAAEATRNIPVIAHTGRPGSCHVPRLAFLFAHVLPKPVIPDVLLALKQRFAGKEKSIDPSTWPRSAYRRTS